MINYRLLTTILVYLALGVAGYGVWIIAQQIGWIMTLFIMGYVIFFQYVWEDFKKKKKINDKYNIKSMLLLWGSLVVFGGVASIIYTIFN